MMKFFRRYNKQMLAVFMALLLVVWLGGSALENLFRGDSGFGKQVQGTVYGETVRLQDMWPAYEDAELLGKIGLPFWQFPWFLSLERLQIPNFQQYVQQVRPMPLTQEEWYMLDAAAQRSRIHVPATAVENFKTQFGLTQEALNRIRQQSRTTMEQVDRAIQSLLRIEEAAMLAAQAVKVTEADINEHIRQTGEKARITGVVIETKPFIDPTWEPTREQILAQFDKYKNVTSRPGETGYQIPAAAQVEVIGIDAQALAKQQKVDEQEAFAYWNVNRSQFMKPPATQPATSTAPAEPPKPYTSFTEAQPRVIERLQQDMARNEVQRISREAIEKLRGSWGASATQPAEAAAATDTAPATAPEGAKPDDLYEKLARELEQEYPGAIKHRRYELMTQEELRAEPIGSATALPGTPQSMAAVQAAFLVPGLSEKPADETSATFYREVNETAPHAFVGAEGNAFILRTIAVRPASAPESVDGVHARIVEDLRQAHALEQARKAADALREQAAQKGLEAAFNADETLKQKLGATALKKPEPFPHKRSFAIWGAPQLFPAGIPGIGSNAQLSDQLFALAGATSTQPSKVTMAADEQQKRFIVAELHEILPVTQAEYEKQRAEVLQTLETQKRVQALGAWFDPEQIRARVGWQDAPEQAPEGEVES